MTPRINDFDLMSLAQDEDFQAMIDAVKGAKANEHELCQRQLSRIEKILQFLPIN